MTGDRLSSRPQQPSGERIRGVQMRVGVTLLPEHGWDRDRQRWQRAEQYGFDHAWTFDQLAWRSLADSPWYATIPTLVAAALATSTIRLGTWVTTPNFRHPVPLAKELMTLDTMSGGRLNVGLGAGAPGWDASILAQPQVTRAESSERFGEFVVLLNLLLTQSQTTWHGVWFSALDARNIPGTLQQPRPPFIIAANGPKGIHLAVTRGEGWATMGAAARDADPVQWWRGVREVSALFDDSCANASGPRKSMTRFLNVEALSATLTSLEQFRDSAGQAAALGFTDIVIPWPRRDGPFAGIESTLDDIANDLTNLHAL
jgi:hypothetical protein